MLFSRCPLKIGLPANGCFVQFAQARALGKAVFRLIETPKGESYIAQDVQNLDLTIDREGGLDRLAAELPSRWMRKVNSHGTLPGEPKEAPV
jgi:hypothetical protein